VTKVKLTSKDIDPKRIQDAVKHIMYTLGLDQKAEGLKRTPERMAEVYQKFMTGYDMEVTLERTYTEASDMCVEPDIPFVSLCEHHFLPFYGGVTIAYIPKGKKLTGLSKLDQLVAKYAFRYQLQERMQNEIADELLKTLEPLGVMVTISAIHTCKLVEGCQPRPYITSAVRGVFLDEPHAKMEMLKLWDLSKKHRLV